MLYSVSSGTKGMLYSVNVLLVQRLCYTLGIFSLWYKVYVILVNMLFSVNVLLMVERFLFSVNVLLVQRLRYTL